MRLYASWLLLQTRNAGPRHARQNWLSLYAEVVAGQAGSNEARCCSNSWARHGGAQGTEIR